MDEKAQLIKLSEENHEPSWLSKRREKAQEQISQLAMPKMEHFHPGDVDFANKSQTICANDASSENVTEDFETNLIQFGTDTIQTNLSPEMANKGVVLVDLFDAFRDLPDFMRKYFMTEVIKGDENKLNAEHLAYLNSGILLYIPKNVVLDDPIEVKLIQDSTKKLNWYQHLLIVADSNSSCRFLQHLTTVGKESNIANMMVEIIAKPGSHVEFSSVEELSKKTTFYFDRHAKIEKDAHVEWAVGLMNSCDTLGEIDSELVGEGSYANSQLVSVTSGKQKSFINNRVTNRGPHSTGLINQRGVLLDQSKLIFNGIGQIVHGAHGSKADQQNRVLMMSPDARGDANPLLLIDENDVIAAHAASVGPVDPVQMNYLMSRGIPYDQAQRLVIRGFLGAVLDAVPDKDVWQKMIDILERKLINGQKYQAN